jgi:hypothetical protein
MKVLLKLIKHNIVIHGRAIQILLNYIKNLRFYVTRPKQTAFGPVTPAAIRTKFLGTSGTSGVPRDLQFEKLRQIALYDEEGNPRIHKKGNKKSRNNESHYESPYSTIYNSHNSSV